MQKWHMCNILDYVKMQKNILCKTSYNENNKICKTYIHDDDDSVAAFACEK